MTYFIVQTSFGQTTTTDYYLDRESTTNHYSVAKGILSHTHQLQYNNKSTRSCPTSKPLHTFNRIAQRNISNSSAKRKCVYALALFNACSSSSRLCCTLV